MTTLLFVLLLIVNVCGAAFIYLRPTATETAVQQRLEGIEEPAVPSKDWRHDPSTASPQCDSLGG